MEADSMKKRRKLLMVLVILVVAAAALYGLGALFFPGSPATIFTAKMHIPRPKPEVIIRFHLGGLEIPITNTVFSTIVAMLVLVGIGVLVSRGLSRKSEEERIRNPRGWQNLAEWALEYLINLLEGAAGRNRLKKKPLGRVIFPLVGTLFVFIIFANWFSLVPGFSTIVVSAPQAAEAAPAEHVEAAAPAEGEEEAHGSSRVVWLFGHGSDEPIPLLRAPNSHLAITAGMAVIAVVVVQVLGTMKHGPLGYLKHLATDAPGIMKGIMFPIHVISELSHLISLSARLFGNLYGGDVLLAVIFNLLAPLIPALFFGIEAFFYYIQALLFSVLTTVYIAMAVGGGHEEEVAHAH
jgi:F-type H+-transporting ATPase subunit a